MVAVTALNKDFKTVRIQGKVRKLDEQKYWIDRIFEKNPVMNDVYPNDTRYILEPFCISEAQMEMFDLGVSPIYRESFSLGGYNAAEKGFIISEECIACGNCFENCPVNAIKHKQIK